MRSFLKFQTIIIALLCLSVIGVSHAQDVDNNAIIEAIKNLSEGEVIQTVPAPDGSQRAEVIVYPCTEVDGTEYAYEYINLVDSETNETQIVSEQLISCGGLGSFGLEIMRWSPNSDILYITDAREGTSDGAGINALSILRYHLATAEFEDLGRGKFSTDGRWIAVWEQQEITVLAIDGDDTRSMTYTMADLRIEDITWLPDGRGFLVVQADSPIMSSQLVVTHVDIEEMTQTVLLEQAIERDN